MHVSAEHIFAIIISINPSIALWNRELIWETVQEAKTRESRQRWWERKSEIPSRYQIFEDTKYSEDTKSWGKNFTFSSDLDRRKNKVIKLSQFWDWAIGRMDHSWKDGSLDRCWEKLSEEEGLVWERRWKTLPSSGQEERRNKNLGKKQRTEV